MKRTLSVLTLIATALTLSTGCARPGEFGYTMGLTAKERGNAIARNWDNEGKILMDDVDSFFLLRPQTSLTPWNIR
jgi:hypothetical protein